MKKMMLSTLVLSLIHSPLAFAGHGMEHEGPVKPMPGARAAFDEIKGLIGEKYVDTAPSDDEIWTGAIEGVLGRLIQTKGIKVNTLLEPDSLKELESGMSGQFVGVGIVIKVFEGVILVRHTIPNSPASKVLKPGDRILAVDGKSLKGMEFHQIVGMIRGQEGTTVDLTVQREEKDWVEPITRRSMSVDSVFAYMLPDKVGYMRISAFNHNTPEQIDQAMKAKLAGAQTLVLDLRCSPGGLFDEALLAADKFLPPGAAIVKLKGRSGKDEIRKASKRDVGDQLPMVVLVDHDTASSAEILAAALADNDRARLVGETTLGKGTVESLMKLSNGWGVKLSIARFESPKGRSWQGKGLEPDLPIVNPKGAEDDEDAGYSAPNLETDTQLRSAITLLKLRK
jgi:carboxyl-terminal processing protease